MDRKKSKVRQTDRKNALERLERSIGFAVVMVLGDDESIDASWVMALIELLMMLGISRWVERRPLEFDNRKTF